jgi:hypothetical protein
LCQPGTYTFKVCLLRTQSLFGSLLRLNGLLWPTCQLSWYIESRSPFPILPRCLTCGPHQPVEHNRDPNRYRALRASPTASKNISPNKNRYWDVLKILCSLKKFILQQFPFRMYDRVMERESLSSSPHTAQDAHFSAYEFKHMATSPPPFI